MNGTRVALGFALSVAVAACASPSDKMSTGPAAPGGAGISAISGDRAPNANTLYSMAKVMLSRARDADAETILSKLIAEHPDFMPAYGDLSELFLRHERTESAVEVLKAGIREAPQDSVLLNNLGMCRLLQGRYEDALESFTSAAAGVPKDARARANMAVALGMLGRFDESLSIYLQLVTPAEAHYNLGVLCEARKDGERARKEFAVADELAPGTPSERAH